MRTNHIGKCTKNLVHGTDIYGVAHLLEPKSIVLVSEGERGREALQVRHLGKANPSSLPAKNTSLGNGNQRRKIRGLLYAKT